MIPLQKPPSNKSSKIASFGGSIYSEPAPLALVILRRSLCNCCL